MGAPALVLLTPKTPVDSVIAKAKCRQARTPPRCVREDAGVSLLAEVVLSDRVYSRISSECREADRYAAGLSALCFMSSGSFPARAARSALGSALSSEVALCSGTNPRAC